MSDNKTKKGIYDRSKVAIDESFELSYLEKKFLVSREKVKEAIQAVGNDRQKVEDYLTKNMTRKPIIL